MSTTSIFFNQSFDKKRLKSFLYWVLKTFGEKEALTVVEQLKSMGFYNATKAGLSIGLHDLKTPYKKKLLISNAQTAMRKTDQEFQGAEVTATERSQRIVDTWHRTSEDLRKQVVDYFSTYDQLNSVYMMALSGARGNFSQVRQLIGMRGLMADPQGQIISFPIRSNLREGLTLTEYFISCSGARKGLVDTALRTADTGYLTRRLVDISHHIVVKKVTCYTSRGIALKTLRTSQKILLPLQDRLVGRVLAENVYDNNDIELSSEQRYLEGTVLHQDKTASYQKENSQTPTKLDKVKRSTNLIGIKKQTEQGDLGKKVIARKNQEISPNLALKICLAKENCLHKENKMSSLDMRESKNKLYFKKDRTLTDLSMPQVLVRSPLTCTYTHEVCQLCYGWSMAQGSLVSLGEAVGVIAGQSIGEPGTQLTMRTFHTGGVFSGDLLQEIRAPHSGKILFPKALQGLLIRTSQGRIAFLIKVSGELLVDGTDIDGKVENNKTTKLQLAPSTILFVRQGERVKSHQLLAELAITSEEGNQPIKSRQTLFAEIGGRIVQWKSMTARIHRTRGTLPKPSTLGKVRSKNSFCIRSFSVQSNKISLSYQLDEAVPPKKESKISKKSGIQAYLGPIDATRNSSYSAFDKSKFITQATARQSLWNLNEFRSPVEKRSFAPRSEKTKFLYEERNVQHYEETWDHLNNLTLKKIAITKRHGLGSIEPPKALKLGLLGVIATRVGASEKTCTKGTFSNQTATLLPALKKAVIHKNEKKLISSNMVNKASLKALHSQNEIVANTKRSLLQSFAVVKNEVFYTQRTTECKTSFCNRLHEQVQASKNEIFARTQPVREIGAQRLLYLKTQMARLQHLNTIAEEGDLVDENYTQM